MGSGAELEAWCQVRAVPKTPTWQLPSSLLLWGHDDWSG